MITGWILGLIAGLASFLFNALPNWDLPEWFTTAPIFLRTALSQAGQMGHWFPLTAIGLGASAIFAVWSLTLLLRIARMVLSLFTGGGGSAA